MWPAELDRLRASNSNVTHQPVELPWRCESQDSRAVDASVSAAKSETSTVAVAVGSMMDLQVTDLSGGRRRVCIPVTATTGDLRRALLERSPGSLILCVAGEMVERDDCPLTDLGLREGSMLHAFESVSGKYHATGRFQPGHPGQTSSQASSSECLGQCSSLSSRVETLEVRLSQASAVISSMQAERGLRRQGGHLPREMQADDVEECEWGQFSLQQQWMLSGSQTLQLRGYSSVQLRRSPM